MSEQPKRSRNDCGGGRGKGGGRGRGRGGGNFNNKHNNTNFPGRGKQFGAERSRPRPDRIVPKMSIDTSDDEVDDDQRDSGGGGKMIANKKLDEKEHVDHITPVISPTNNNDTPDQQRAQHAYCLICYSSNLHTRRAISPCGHDDVCWQCHLQMRYLHNDMKCPVCKATNDTLIVDTDSNEVAAQDANDGSLVHHKRYEQYTIWGNEMPGFVFSSVGMFFPQLIYEVKVMPLLGYGCGLPDCAFTNEDSSLYVNEKDMKESGRGAANKGRGGREVKKRLTGLKALKAHLRIDHGYALCELCVENKRDFVSKLVRYTPQGLKQHQAKGDGEHSGFNGHPLCEFCKPLRFYDVVKLHEHLNKEHYKCHICDKQGKPNQFFKDYTRLERHFDRDHYLCHDQQCIAARFVVFENEIDLRAHESSVHGTTRRDGGTKIKLEFRVRRDGDTFEQQDVPSGEDFQYGLNGEAFVPEALPGEENDEQVRQINEPQISHPMHAARTAELRAQAALVRERDGTSAAAVGGGNEAFPALGTDTSAGGMLVGWTSDGARNAGVMPAGLKKTAIGKVTEEEFPSLGPTSSSRNNRYNALGLGKKKKKANQQSVGNFSAVATRPSFATTSRPISNVSYASSIPTSTPDMNRNNFPSLGGGSKSFAPSITTRTVPNLSSADNFPSLGGGAGRPMSASARQQQSNPYAAAQAHSRKLKFTPGYLAPTDDFPPPPTAATTKKSNVTKAFAPKKPPPMDNVIQFPPPSSSKPSADSLQAGMETVKTLKQLLGTTRFKKLKSLTKEFANETTTPETYVESASSLFDDGLGDKAFWDNIPYLIQDIPNEAAVKRAMQHLESLRLNNQLSCKGISGQGGKKKPINYILPTKKKSSWGNNAVAGTKLGSNVVNVNEAKETTANNNYNSNSNGNGNGGKKNKSKKKNSELKSLAFGI